MKFIKKVKKNPVKTGMIVGGVWGILAFPLAWITSIFFGSAMASTPLFFFPFGVGSILSALELSSNMIAAVVLNALAWMFTGGLIGYIYSKFK
ncbi:MAG: hypothetical protein JRD04_13185 [Deltaproteobacteria bacterium]|nr:hypothetical protein [Deltaproteobacteria bacterium]